MSENTIPASINHIYLRREIVLICYNKTLLMGDGKKQKTFVNIEGMFPLIDIVRLFSLEKGVRETSTLERIASLKHKHAIIKEYADELEHAFEFIMLLRIHHQFEQTESREDLDDFINPNYLNSFERKTIKEVFHLISKMQSLIVKDVSI